MEKTQDYDGQPETGGPTADDLRVKVFRYREHECDWRVEKMDDDGGIELAAFSGGADSRQRAISYAERVCGEFDEIELHPYHRAPPLGQVLDDLSRSDDDAPRRFVRVISNIGKSVSGFEYLPRQTQVPGADFPAQTIQWTKALAESADELLGDSGASQSEIAKAMAFLTHTLGPHARRACR